MSDFSSSSSLSRQRRLKYRSARLRMKYESENSVSAGSPSVVIPAVCAEPVATDAQAKNPYALMSATTSRPALIQLGSVALAQDEQIRNEHAGVHPNAVLAAPLMIAPAIAGNARKFSAPYFVNGT